MVPSATSLLGVNDIKTMYPRGTTTTTTVTATTNLLSQSGINISASPWTFLRRRSGQCRPLLRAATGWATSRAAEARAILGELPGKARRAQVKVAWDYEYDHRDHGDGRSHAVVEEVERVVVSGYWQDLDTGGRWRAEHHESKREVAEMEKRREQHRQLEHTGQFGHDDIAHTLELACAIERRSFIVLFGDRLQAGKCHQVDEGPGGPDLGELHSPVGVWPDQPVSLAIGDP